MKKILLSAAFSVFAIAATFAQYPCIDVFAKISANNGGGNCPDLNGEKASGKIQLDFLFPPLMAPSITAIFNLDSDEPGTAMAGVEFQFQSMSADGLSATYCYYYSGQGQLHLNQGINNYRFTIEYAGYSGPCQADEIILPVKLHSFTAARNNEKVNLTWVTATEDNNRGFELQRMLGAGKWSTVAFIFSQADGGNSTSNLTYQFRDDNNYSGISQYRLLQIDLDGKVKYSDIRSVRGQAQANKTLVFPNPGFNGTVNVIFEDGNSKRSLALTDMSGRMIRQWNNFTDNSLQVSNLKPGMYNLRIYNTETGVQSVEKIIIANRSSN